MPTADAGGFLCADTSCIVTPLHVSRSGNAWGSDKKKHKGKDKSGGLITKDRHILYEASVQSPETDLEFFRKLFKRRRGRPMRLFREDFCGTSLLSCTFVKTHADNHAWGIDLDQPTLDWGREHHVSRLGDAAERLTLIQGDVLTTETPLVDAVAALNFSYFIFHEREQLLGYFRRARAALKDDGVLFLDSFGGQDAMSAEIERRRISGEYAPNGKKLAPFHYSWHQASFNIIDHHLLCHIHFRLKDGTKIKKAFTYDWRLWTLPELSEVLVEAGFAKVEVFLESWDDEKNETDGVFRKRKKMDNQAGWIAYVAAYA